MCHYKGNVNSKVTLLVATDVECDMCRKHCIFMDTIYSEFKDKVRFIYTPFSSYVSLSIIAAECAEKQGKYWEMMAILYKSNLTVDTNVFINYAKEINLNIAKFQKDLSDTIWNNNLSANFEKLKKAGLYGTPSIIIDGITIQNSFSKKEIKKILNQEIKKYSR